MPVAFVMDFDGATLEQYDQVMELMQLNGELPAHALFHAVGQTDSGIRVTDVWEDDASFGHFAETQIGPCSQQAGMSPPAIQRFEVTDVVEGNGGTPALVQLVQMPGIAREQFNAFDGDVRPDGAAPEGMTHHVNGSYDGGSYVLDAWDNKETHDAFMESRVAPVMTTAPFTGEPSVEEFAVHNSLTKQRSAA
jgi:hypothetical protein